MIVLLWLLFNYIKRNSVQTNEVINLYLSCINLKNKYKLEDIRRNFCDIIE